VFVARGIDAGAAIQVICSSPTFKNIVATIAGQCVSESAASQIRDIIEGIALRIAAAGNARSEVNIHARY
jgi:hypothetical protein